MEPNERSPLPSFDARPLIVEVDQALLDLLPELSQEDWERPAVKAWKVRDVAAHLLDANLRRLSLDRDSWKPPSAPKIDSYQALVDFLDRLNADWTTAADRLSPQVLTALLASSNTEVQTYFDALDLQAEAAFPVSWAGENRSAVWMDLARELTEKWHHQQQIRDAVARPGLLEPRYVAPVLDTFARALPRAYADIPAKPGAEIRIEIHDLPECRWLLIRQGEGWALYSAQSRSPAEAAASIHLSPDSAWRLFTKALAPEQAIAAARIQGQEDLARPFFRTIGIMG